MALSHPLAFLPPMISIALSNYNMRDNTEALAMLNYKFEYAYSLTSTLPCATLNSASIYVYIFLGVVSLEILAYTVIVIGYGIYMLSYSYELMKNSQNHKSLQLQRQLIVAILLQV